MPVSGPLKWHGGKAYLAKKIVALFPPHRHYVEPCFGGGAVLLARDPEGVSEVVNDINLDLTIFWRVLASETHFPLFLRIVQATPFSEAVWKASAKLFLEPNEICIPAERTAAAFFIRCRQSLAGRMKAFTSITRTRTRRGMNNEVSAWLSAIDGLPAVHERLKRVIILNRDVIDVIDSEDSSDTFFYLDPPYLHETRAAKAAYEHEMSDTQHESLLSALSKIKGKFLLSGYRSELYDEYAKLFKWRRRDFEVPNHAAGGDKKRKMTECVWGNY